MEHSHDPFHPTASFQPPVNGAQTQASASSFRETRWRQVGATDAQIAQMREAHENDLSLDDQLALNAWIDQHSDPELAEKLPDPTDEQQAAADDADITATATEPGEAADPPSPSEAPADEYSGNVTDILAKVGSSAEKAQAALAVEQARDKPRVSLVNELQKVIGG